MERAFHKPETMEKLGAAAAQGLDAYAATFFQAVGENDDIAVHFIMFRLDRLPINWSVWN
jgi:hypothetical protein